MINKVDQLLALLSIQLGTAQWLHEQVKGDTNEDGTALNELSLFNVKPESDLADQVLHLMETTQGHVPGYSFEVKVERRNYKGGRLRTVLTLSAKDPETGAKSEINLFFNDGKPAPPHSSKWGQPLVKEYQVMVEWAASLSDDPDNLTWAEIQDKAGYLD